MDDRWVDRLARGLAERRTRRGGIAQVAAVLLAAAGAGTASAERARETGKRRRRRDRCRPACLDGYSCVRGTCTCESGIPCGAACCPAGDTCADGACQATPPPPACVGFAEPCKGVGRPCCDGLACASGQGGMTDIGCYRPAGGACATTDDCVYGAACRSGTCAADPYSSCTVCAEGCSFTSVAEAVAAAAPGSVVTVADGVYDGVVAIDKDLTLEACTGRPVIRNGSADDLDGVAPAIAVTSGRVTLRGLGISCSTCGPDEPGGGGLNVSSGPAQTAAMRILRRIGSVEAMVADPRRAMRMGRAAFPARQARDARPEVRVIDCEITGNASGNVVRAAVTVAAATVTLTDTRVSGNQGFLGGAVLVIAGALLLDGETAVTGNRGLLGGAVFALGACGLDQQIGPASVTMRDRAVVDGNAFVPETFSPGFLLGGGGVTLWGASLEMTGDSAVTNNYSPGVGGGIGVLGGKATLGCDGCPGTVRVSGNVAIALWNDINGGGGIAMATADAFAPGAVSRAADTLPATLVVRGSARITDNVAVGRQDQQDVPGLGGGILAVGSGAALVVDLSTASSGADPAVTRNRAVTAAEASSAGDLRDLPDRVGGLVFAIVGGATASDVPGVSLQTISGNEGDQCGGSLTPDCTIPGP